MSSTWDTISDVLGYLIVASVLFAFSIGLAVYMAYELIEQMFASESRKPIPGLRFRQTATTTTASAATLPPSIAPMNQQLEPPGEEPRRAA